jgi:hypothetical protein
MKMEAILVCRQLAVSRAHDGKVHQPTVHKKNA